MHMNIFTFRDPLCGNLDETVERSLMMSIIEFATVVAFGLTCFSLGYSMGRDHKEK